MIKKIVIGLMVFAVVIFAQTSWVQTNVNRLLNSVGDLFDTMIEMPERSKLMKLRDDFMRNNMSLQPHQTDYVIEVTDTAQNLKQFHTLYCVRKDKNPYMYGRNLDTFCRLIEQSKVIDV